MPIDFHYPNDVTPAEEALGFKKMAVDNLGRLLESLDVAGIVLSPTDLLVKTLDLNNRVIYEHKRWARASLPTERTPTDPKWESIGAMQLHEVEEYTSQNPQVVLSILGGIVPSETPFGYRLLL